MTEPPTPAAATLRLMTWLSPAFPVGGFSFSHGLERAIADGTVHDRDTLAGWIGDLMRCGSAWNDAVLVAAAWHAAGDDDRLGEISQLAEALASSAERHLETTMQGAAFADAAATWADTDGAARPYPVAFGAAAGDADLPLETALTGWLQAFASNQVQAAIRLMPIGQSGGLAVTRALESTVLKTAERAAASTLDDLGTATVLADVAAMNHETMPSRIFRS